MPRDKRKHSTGIAPVKYKSKFLGDNEGSVSSNKREIERKLLHVHDRKINQFKSVESL